MFSYITSPTNHHRFVATCLVLAMMLTILAPWRLAVAEKDQLDKQIRPLPPGPKIEVLAQQLKETYHVPVYAIKIATRDKAGNVAEIGTFLTSEGIPGSIGIGKTRYTYGENARDAKNASIGFSWEELVDFPKDVNGETFWTSRFTQKQMVAPLGKDTVLELTAPDDRNRRQTFILNVQEYVARK